MKKDFDVCTNKLHLGLRIWAMIVTAVTILFPIPAIIIDK